MKRIKKRIIIIVAVVALVVIFPGLLAKPLAFVSGLLLRLPFAGQLLEADESGTVSQDDFCLVDYVVDGDTFVVTLDGEETKIRLIGVDTPESVHADKSKNCEEGRIASAFTKELLSGKRVRLEFDVEREDLYGRTLAYVYLEDGRMVQNILLEKGYARAATFPPNVAYSNSFAEIQNVAAESGVGFWNHEIWR